MTKLHEKLNSARGASLVIALLLFLVCVLVASVILTASAVNSGRVKKQREEQQAYLSVRSAAQLLKEDFGMMSPFTAFRTNTVYICTYPEHPDTTTGWEVETACSGSMLAQYITQAALKVCRGEDIGAWEAAFEISSDSEELDNVDVAMTMDDGYNITCILTAQNSTYSMKLAISGTSSESEEPDDSQYCEHWETKRVIVDFVWEEREVLVPYPVEITTYRNTVTWAPGVLSKEVWQ